MLKNFLVRKKLKASELFSPTVREKSKKKKKGEDDDESVGVAVVFVARGVC